ncbi:dolabradiene synthase KSL4, chloroplastic-like [Phragmites australis]|uniref:dolabradiene synthase KSL4, chloroplastic-like n=1 Tax=Phragmites australis TaxID=29695 RepID=UPI002D764ADA|nr:dolabradiene synthase KSL4, chloroplastic-like [Phragmites australis]
MPGYLEPTCTLRQRRRQTRDHGEDRIREQLRAGAEQPSPSSSYDTAWVATVPAQGAPRTPRFPRFVEWIMQNQHDDGSWGLGGGDLHLSSLGKDAISSTLVCVLALMTWNVGDEHVRNVAVDDFFDGGGSTEERENLIGLIERWEAHDEIGFCSQRQKYDFVLHT